jgi:membrane protein DedA with SNARE-associated domain
MLSQEFMAHYGVLIVFINVFGSSLGLPIPATPTLVMAGAGIALAADGPSSTSAQFGIMIGSAVIGGALADFVWFQGSKRLGERTLHGIGKLLVPQPSKINSVERFPGSSAVRVLLIARFVPGLAFVSVLLCGTKAVRLRSFVLHDCVGIGLWAAAALTAGGLSAPQIEKTIATLWRFGW